MAEFHEVPRQLPASFGSRRGEPGQRRGFRPQTQRPAAPPGARPRWKPASKFCGFSATADGCSDSLRKWRTQARSRPWAHPAARPVTNRPGCGSRGCDMFECAERRQSQSWTAYSKRLLPEVHVTSPG